MKTATATRNDSHVLRPHISAPSHVVWVVLRETWDLPNTATIKWDRANLTLTVEIWVPHPRPTRGLHQVVGETLTGDAAILWASQMPFKLGGI